MQNKNHQGEGQQGGHQGANTAGNKNQIAGNMDHNPNRSKNEGQHTGKLPSSPGTTGQSEYNSNVNRYSDPNRTKLIERFGQKHGLNEKQSEQAADSFLGSVNWASQLKRDDDFADFVNPRTQSVRNPLYSSWQAEYKNRLRSNGFDDNQTDKFAAEEPDTYLQDLSSNGADENWYRNYGNDAEGQTNRTNKAKA